MALLHRPQIDCEYQPRQNLSLTQVRVGFPPKVYTGVIVFNSLVDPSSGGPEALGLYPGGGKRKGPASRPSVHSKETKVIYIGVETVYLWDQSG